MVYRSGGGITCMSDPEKEYQEVIDKVYVSFTWEQVIKSYNIHY